MELSDFFALSLYARKADTDNQTAKDWLLSESVAVMEAVPAVAVPVDGIAIYFTRVVEEAQTGLWLGSVFQCVCNPLQLLVDCWDVGIHGDTP